MFDKKDNDKDLKASEAIPAGLPEKSSRREITRLAGLEGLVFRF